MQATIYVTWSRRDSFCKDQYVAEQPEEKPTAPVKVQIRQLDPPQYDPGFSRFNFGEGCGMSDSFFEQTQNAAKYLGLDLNAQEMARLAVDCGFSGENIQAVAEILAYLQQKKKENIVSTLLRMSRLPLKEPKTFEGFDFGQLHGRQTEALKDLPSLSALYAHRNLAFIGPQGVGKTHLAMAYVTYWDDKKMCLSLNCENIVHLATYQLCLLQQAQDYSGGYAQRGLPLQGLSLFACEIPQGERRCDMRRKYIKDIFKILSEVNDTWILEQIYRFAVNMTKGGANNG